jgi:hypothetical protein
MTKTIWAVVGICVAATAAMAIALVIVLAGGDDDPAPAERAAPFVFGGGPAEGSGAAPEELDEFRACLEDQGVEVPEPGAAPSGGDVEEMQEAFEACRELLPEGAETFGGGSPGAPIPQN